ncbi:MAG: hypothetical protein KDN19_11135 [Verrucomicrobiae bacterium]|nr:hypothetical protein [Verrucomicrobiae bacterium]
MIPFATRFFLLALITAPAAGYAVDFESEIQPIMKEKCFKCHSGPKAKKGLRYDDADTLAEFIGDDEDAVITPGKPEESKLIKLASLPRDDSHAMPPPQRGEGLSLTELALFKKWIAEGASLEKGETSTPAPTTTEEPKLLSWTNTEGNSLEAFFVRLEGSSVVLKKADGSEFSYPMSKLSVDSRKQATDLSAN